jgi:TolB-like protein
LANYIGKILPVLRQTFAFDKYIITPHTLLKPHTTILIIGAIYAYTSMKQCVLFHKIQQYNRRHNMFYTTKNVTHTFIIGLLLFPCLSLLGCSALDAKRLSEQYMRITGEATSQAVEVIEQDGLVDIILNEDIQHFHTHKRVNNYTERLAYDLVKNLKGNTFDSPVAISSFVNFSANTDSPSNLGVIISENILGQLQNHNIPVLDIHLMDGLVITDKGSFVFARNMQNYLNSAPIKYVLAGYMIKNSHGYTVNARIIKFDNKQVMSSASTLIPHYVAELYN